MSGTGAGGERQTNGEEEPCQDWVAVQERAGRARDLTLEGAALNLNHRAQIKPWEIKTLLVEGGAGRRAQVREVNLLEV